MTETETIILQKLAVSSWEYVRKNWINRILHMEFIHIAIQRGNCDVCITVKGLNLENERVLISPKDFLTIPQVNGVLSKKLKLWTVHFLVHFQFRKL